MEIQTNNLKTNISTTTNNLIKPVNSIKQYMSNELPKPSTNISRKIGINNRGRGTRRINNGYTGNKKRPINNPKEEGSNKLEPAGGILGLLPALPSASSGGNQQEFSQSLSSMSEGELQELENMLSGEKEFPNKKNNEEEEK